MKLKFSDVVSKAASAGIGKNVQAALSWFKTYIRKHISKKVTYSDLVASKEVKLVTTMRPGHMYFFGYDAKHKDTLPYWDAMPLVIPISETSTSIIGLNFHYMPMEYRIKILDALFTIMTNDKMNEQTKVRLSYRIVQSSSRFKAFKPCIKQYLKSNFTTQFILVPASYWEVAVFLPVAQWKGTTADNVYKDSRKIIKGA
jgi:hypothetical protein